MDWDVIDGEDLYEVRAKTRIAVERAWNESRPTVLEINTYRWRGHSVADANAEKYRTKEEIKRYQNEHDPIINWKEKLIGEGIITEDDFKQINREAGKEAEASADFAEQSPYPDPVEMMDDIYWEVDNNTEAGNTGRHFFHNTEI